MKALAVSLARWVLKRWGPSNDARACVDMLRSAVRLKVRLADHDMLAAADELERRI